MRSREERVEGEEEEDPRADLVRRLLEYRRFKEMSQELQLMSEEQRKVYFRQFFEKDDRETNVVEMATSHGAMGPPIRALLEFPSSAICCFRELASARHCASSSGLAGTMVMN